MHTGGDWKDMGRIREQGEGTEGERGKENNIMETRKEKLAQ